MRLTSQRKFAHPASEVPFKCVIDRLLEPQLDADGVSLFTDLKCSPYRLTMNLYPRKSSGSTLRRCTKFSSETLLLYLDFIKFTVDKIDLHTQVVTNLLISFPITESREG